MILLAFLLGRRSARHGHRPRFGVGFVLAWLLIIGACIAFWPYFLAIGLPIIIGLVVYGAVKHHHPVAPRWPVEAERPVGH